jgi:hypothetical protein
MAWTTSQQENSTQKLSDISGEYWKAYGQWQQAVADAAREPSQSKVGAAVANVQAKLGVWRSFVADLKHSSTEAVSQGDILSDLNSLASDIAEQREVLDKLRSKEQTRSEQGNTVTHKVTPSPYVNILFLERTFRDSTRFGILIASIFFGILALCTVCFCIYKVVTMISTRSPIEPAVK